jgi:hypothetical protein
MDTLAVLKSLRRAHNEAWRIKQIEPYDPIDVALGVYIAAEHMASVLKLRGSQRGLFIQIVVGDRSIKDWK